MPTMGEVAAPGCFAGSSGAASTTGRDMSAAGARRDEAGPSAGVCRATRTRCPSRSNSISLSPVSSSRRASSRTMSGSIASFSLSLLLRSPVMRLALAACADQRDQPVDGERIAGDAEAAQARLRHRGDMGMMAKVLAREDVAGVHFHHPDVGRPDRVADCDRGGPIGARVDDDARGFLGGGLVNCVHDLALMVRLSKFDFELVARSDLTTKLLHVPQRRAAIDLWLALAEQIKVGAVEDVNGFRHGRSGAVTHAASAL